jgi:ketosteroid isomerase-like protein
MSVEINRDIMNELDAAHRKAQDAYRRRDFQAYMEIFAPDLAYRQADGKVIGRAELANDVRTQLQVVDSAQTSFTRENLEVRDAEATELLRQNALVTTRHFAIIRLSWKVERLGRYVWIRTSEGWRIRKVEVLKESVRSAGFTVAWR